MSKSIDFFLKNIHNIRYTLIDGVRMSKEKRKKYRILVVDDEVDIRSSLSDYLESEGFNVLSAENGKQALSVFNDNTIDLVISDLVMPELDGIGLVKKIRKIDEGVPVIIMTAFSTVEYSVEAMKAGAFDFISKPFDFKRVLFVIEKALETRRLRKLAKRSDYYKRLSDIDGLTEIYNHRFIKQLVDREIKRHIRYSGTLCVLMIDIDDFKSVNDVYGHPTGDVVLIKVADMIKKSIRGCDILSRYGGEEFLVALPVTPINDAKNVADRIVKSFNANLFDIGKDKEPIKITVTIGISAYPDNSGNKEELIENADRALYQGKNKGKNQVVLYNADVRGV